MGHQKLLSGELTKENLRIPADNDSSYGGNGGSTPPNYRPRADLDNDYYGGNGGSIPPDFGHPLAADDADLYDYRRKRRSRMESLVSGAIGNQSGLSTAGLQSGRELVVADPSSNTIRNLQERFEQKILEQERLGQERLEQERLEQERTEWLEQERLEQKRLEQPPSFGHPLADLDVVVEGPITCGSTSDSVHLPRQSGVLKSFKNTARKLLRPKPREDKQRIEWTCRCGDDLYADISINSAEEISRLSSILQCSGSPTTQTSTAYGMNSFSSIQTPPQAHSPSRTTSSSLQSNTGSSSTSLLGSISNLSSNSVSQPSHQAFLEVCINTGKYTKTLSEIDLSSVGCDGELFKRIKKEYSRLFRSWLLKPSGVHFVKFSIQDPRLVGILQKPLSIPPKQEVDAKHYLYIPCPLQDDPPMPEDIFLHYLTCTSFDPVPAWLPRLPKKLDTSILRFIGAINEGWGIHIIEGPNWTIIGVANVVMMIMSGVAALLWNFFKHDFQGAFGFAGWITAAVALVNGVLAVCVLDL